MDHVMKQRALVGLMVLFLGLAPAVKDLSGAENPEQFYQGKNLTWIVAGDAGSTPDLMARTLAPFLAKEIGAKVRVENRSSDEGVNYVYKQGSRDGLTLGIKNATSLIANDIQNAPGVQYEADKLNYLADVDPGCIVFQVSPKLPHRNLEALRKAKGLRGGGTTKGGTMTVAVMFELLGLDGKVISGFPGLKNITLALARGEVDIMVPSDAAAMRDEKAGYLVNMFVTGDKRSVKLPHVPSLSELGFKAPKELQSVHKYVSSGGLGVFMPPGVPPERLEYLRKVFLQHLGNNNELLKAKEKLTGARTAFVPGQELQQWMVDVKSDKELATKLETIWKKYSAVR